MTVVHLSAGYCYQNMSPLSDDTRIPLQDVFDPRKDEESSSAEDMKAVSLARTQIDARTLPASLAPSLDLLFAVFHIDPLHPRTFTMSLSMVTHLDYTPTISTINLVFRFKLYWQYKKSPA